MIKKGGKYIAQGTYGCVFGEPPLKCKDETERRPDDYVSKMMNYYDALDEMKEAELWTKIDPDQKFSLSPSSLCELDVSNIKISNQLNKCNLTYDEKRYLIIYKNGGKDLQKLVPISSNYEAIFSGFQNLFDGLVIAHQNNICHTDIKPLNILTGLKDIYLRFIDFGLTVETDDLTIISSMYANNEIYYPYWPFELGCFNVFGKLKDESIIKKRFNHINNEYGLPKFEIPFDTLYKSLQEVNFKDFKTVFEKVDVFSMGITLIEIMRMYFHHYPFQTADGKYYLVYYHNLYDKYSRFITLKDKGWLTEKQVEYQLYLYNNVTTPLMDFISHCIDYDPRKRYTAKEAADEYRKLLPIFKTHLKQNEIRKGLEGLHILNEVNELPIVPTPVKEPTPKPPLSVKRNTVKSTNSLSTSPNTNEEEVAPPPKAPPPPKRRITRKIKNTSIIPKTREELDDLYKKTKYRITEDDLLVKIARSLGSRKDYSGRTKIVVMNDIIIKARDRGINFT